MVLKNLWYNIHVDILFISEFTILHLHGKQNSTSDELTHHTIHDGESNVHMFRWTSSGMSAMTSRKRNDVPSRNVHYVSAAGLSHRTSLEEIASGLTLGRPDVASERPDASVRWVNSDLLYPLPFLPCGRLSGRHSG